MNYLLIGGARSGKSRLAEKMAKENFHAYRRHYVATAVAFDEEMKERIKQHKVQRGNGWIEHECSLELATLVDSFEENDVVLIDCLTVWLNNVIYNEGQPISQVDVQDRVALLVKAVQRSKAHFIFVSNEVGLGVVPMGEVTRLFVDNAGWMNQAFAASLENVILVTAGIPLALKGCL